MWFGGLRTSEKPQDHKHNVHSAQLEPPEGNSLVLGTVIFWCTEVSFSNPQRSSLLRLSFLSLYPLIFRSALSGVQFKAVSRLQFSPNKTPLFQQCV